MTAELAGDCIFCDDIRQEISGKWILVGCYAADIVPLSIPTNVQLSAFVRLYGLQPHAVRKFVFKLDLNGASIYQHEGVIEVIYDRPSVFTFTQMDLHLAKSGRLVPTIEIEDVGTVELTAADVSAPTAD